MATKKIGLATCVAIGSIIMVILAIASIVWATSGREARQDEKIENACTVSKEASDKASVNERKIGVIETKLEYIIKGIDEIKKEVRKEQLDK